MEVLRGSASGSEVTSNYCYQMLAIDQWDMVMWSSLVGADDKTSNPKDSQTWLWSISGWCFGTWILWLSIGNNHYPNWRTPSFFKGVGIPPTRLAFRQVNAEMAIFQQTLHVQTLLRTTWVQNTWWLSMTEISKEDTFYRVLNPINAGENIFLVSILPQI